MSELARAIGSLWLIAGLAAGCDSTPEQRIATACSAICSCEQPPLPLQQQRCVAGCKKAVGIDVPESCVACLTSHLTSCRTLRTDCEALCSSPPQPTFADGGLRLTEVTGETQP